MSNEKWDRRFLQLAKEVSTWSKDPSVGVGAVIVKDRKVVGIGYNGFPSRILDDPTKLADRPTKYAYTVHAEMNALLQAGKEANGATIYVYPSFAQKGDNVPDICDNCAKHAIQAGIVGNAQFNASLDPELTKRWLDSLKLAGAMWTEVGNFTRYYDE